MEDDFFNTDEQYNRKMKFSDREYQKYWDRQISSFQADRFLRTNIFSGENLYRIVQKSNDFHVRSLLVLLSE